MGKYKINNIYYTVGSRKFNSCREMATHFNVAVETIHVWVKKGVTTDGDIIRVRKVPIK